MRIIMSQPLPKMSMNTMKLLLELRRTGGSFLVEMNNTQIANITKLTPDQIIRSGEPDPEPIEPELEEEEEGPAAAPPPKRRAKKPATK